GTLRYIFDQFLNAEKKGVPENGLRGVLMRTILDELAPESVLDLAAAPQDYFSAWKDMAIKQKEALGEKRLQKDYPAEHLLLQIMGDITP
ncbi:MAG: hypothetical protein IKX89_04850, partial [Firmicutes bacterium]|nr:hypothetical protein [Bacillota bacterium]